MINEEDGVESPSTSVGNIAPYAKMLTKALKRNSRLEVDSPTFELIRNMKEQDILSKYNLKAPCLIGCNKKYILVSK